jgi:hypothetical protein
MALQKIIESEQGHSCNYSVVVGGGIGRNFSSGESHIFVNVQVWKDSTAKEAGRPATIYKKYGPWLINWETDMMGLNENAMVWAYNKLKLEPEYEGALDV